MTRLLCTGDLHLDKGGRYGRVPGERLAEQEAVWSRVLELAREHSVDVVLFAGDAFEKRHPSTEALLAFERPLVAHRDAGGPPVLAIPGNHDRSGVSDFCALDVFAAAELLWLASRPKLTLDAYGATVACLPWAPVSRIVAAHNGQLDRDDVNQLAAELLVEAARELRATGDGPMVLLTHFSISGAALPGGVLTDQLREPVLPVEALDALGFDAIVVGHIHRPQRLDTAAPGFYVGSPMPLDFGEGGYEHGVWLLDVGASSAEFLPIASRPFATLDWEPELVETLLDLDPWKGCGRPFEPGSYVKLRYSVTADEARLLDAVELKRVLLDTLGAHYAEVVPEIERETRARVQGVDETVSDTDALELWMDSQGVNGDQAPALRERHGGYLQEIR